MLSCVCGVTSWLDWWLSTCGSFQEHLTDEARGNFERLMLSGSRALGFLGSQGVMALGSHVLSRRDSLLLDVWSTVPAEEVTRLRYADLPRLLVSSCLPCLTMPWPRCMRLRMTLLSSGPCIHRRLLGSLQRGQSRHRRRPLPLLNAVAPPPWCCDYRNKQ